MILSGLKDVQHPKIETLQIHMKKVTILLYSGWEHWSDSESCHSKWRPWRWDPKSM